jgi:serine/threonine-protein kinase
LTRSDDQQVPETFSPNGRGIVFTERIGAAKGKAGILPVESQGGPMRAGESQPFAGTPGNAAFSPDGRWLAYSDTKGGRLEVYVRAFAGNGGQVQVSNAGGNLPVWSPNGHELFYRAEDQRIMLANYAVRGDSFLPEKPRVWYAKRLANIGGNRSLDLAPDGKRFVVLMPAETGEARETQNHITLVMNFFDEISRRVTGQGQ